MKFADNTTVVEIISNSDKTAHKVEVEKIEDWGQPSVHSSLLLIHDSILRRTRPSTTDSKDSGEHHGGLFASDSGHLPQTLSQ